MLDLKKIVYYYFETGIILSTIDFETISPSKLSETNARFSISPNGNEILDKKTNLTWKRCAEGMRFSENRFPLTDQLDILD